jgi:hypothetical protein
MGGKVSVEDNAGFRLSLDERLLAHAVINADDHNDGGKDEEAADAKIEKHSQPGVAKPSGHPASTKLPGQFNPSFRASIK